ncbi:MAG: hypothetical protein VX642_06595 [Bdellovibrionota bacterium]|nr:hypothetical protein [Bdellovibrionota bacterium]
MKNRSQIKNQSLFAKAVFLIKKTFIFGLILGLSQSVFAAKSKMAKPTYSYCDTLRCIQVSGNLAQLGGLGKNKILIENASVKIFELENGSRVAKDTFKSDNVVIDNSTKLIIAEAKNKGERSAYLNMRSGSLMFLN